MCAECAGNGIGTGGWYLYRQSMLILFINGPFIPSLWPQSWRGWHRATEGTGPNKLLGLLYNYKEFGIARILDYIAGL